MTSLAESSGSPSPAPTFRARWRAWLASLRGRWAATSPEPLTEQAWDRLEQAAAAGAAVLAQQMAEAPRLLAELLGQTPGDQVLAVAGDRRFLSLPLAQRLLDHQLRDASDESLARCVLVIAGSIDSAVAGSGLVESLKAAAWTQIGRARRAAGKLAGADHAFLHAAYHLALAPEPLEEAKLHRERALLYRDRGNLTLAGRLQERAAHLFASFAVASTTCSALAELAALRIEGGRPKDADLALRHCVLLMRTHPEAVAPTTDSIEDLAARLAEAGKAREASVLVEAARRLLGPALSAAETAQLAWTAGRVGTFSDDSETARRLLEAAWPELLEARRPELAAAAFLDLLTLLARCGDHRAAADVLVEDMPRLLAGPLRPSTLSALDLASQAVLSGDAYAGLLGELATFLRTAPRARAD